MKDSLGSLKYWLKQKRTKAFNAGTKDECSLREFAVLDATIIRVEGIEKELLMEYVGIDDAVDKFIKMLLEEKENEA